VPSLAVGGEESLQFLEPAALGDELTADRGHRLRDAVDTLVHVRRQRALFPGHLLQFPDQEGLPDPGVAVHVEEEAVPFVLRRQVKVAPERGPLVTAPHEPGPPALPDQLLHRRPRRHPTHPRHANTPKSGRGPRPWTAVQRLTSEYVPKYRWIMLTPTVAFSELSKNSKRVAETLDRTQRVHITRRDGEDLYLTTARHDQQREETADITARLLAALVRSDAGERAILRALPSVFPWMRHLSADESKEFVAELIDATYDAAQLDVHANLHRVVVEWRATARILADPGLTAQLTRRLPDEDHGEVTAP
jgi:hypothetical protein